MLIVCPSCATSYMIDPASLAPAGRTVRCARCRETWFASPPQPDEPVETFFDAAVAEAEIPERRPYPRHKPPHRTIAPASDFGEEASPAPLGEKTPPVPPPVEIAESPSLVPPIEHMPLPEPSVEPLTEEAESFAVRRRRLQANRQKARRSSRWMAIVLVLFAFNVALIGARSELVRYLPQTASLFKAVGLPVNLRHLGFEDVRVSKETQNGEPLLAIEGKIVSKAAKPVEVPRLRFAARNAKGQEIYTWTARPERSVLQPGESLTFHSLAKPPPEAVDVMVRFFNAQDATGGT